MAAFESIASVAGVRPKRCEERSRWQGGRTTCAKANHPATAGAR